MRDVCPNTGTARERDPSRFARRVLIAAVGLAPQVVTETLWALATRQGFVATELHLVTTTAGEAAIAAVLLGANGSLSALAADLDRPDLATMPIEIHRIGGDNPAGDIDSEADSIAAADLFARVVGGIAADESAAVHVSIAGGRKTMGFLAGYTLSLFGRPQDRLSHVLVQPPFQNLRQFHFPPRQPQTFVLPDGLRVSTEEAQVILVDVPFVRLRPHLPADLLANGASFSRAVAMAQTALEPANLTVDLDRRRFVCGDVAVDLAPVDFAFAAWLAWRAMHCDADAAPIRWTDPVRGQLRALHRRLGLSDPPGRDDFIDESFFRQRVSRIRAGMRRQLALRAGPYLPQVIGRRPATRTHFAMAPERITLTNFDSTLALPPSQ